MTRTQRTLLFPDYLHTTSRRERNEAVKLLALFKVEAGNRTFQIRENAILGNTFKHFANVLGLRFWCIAKIYSVLNKTTHKILSFL